MKTVRLRYFAGAVLVLLLGVFSLLTLSAGQPLGHIIGAAASFFIGALLLYIALGMKHFTPAQWKHYHDDRLVDHYLPRLLYRNIDRKLLKLSVQDLIVIWTAAQHEIRAKYPFKNKKRTEKLASKSEELLNMILQKLMQSEILYVLEDGAARAPFTDPENRIYLFSQKDYAIHALPDPLPDSLRNLKIAEIPGAGIERYLHDACCIHGAVGCCIDSGQQCLILRDLRKLLPALFA